MQKKEIRISVRLTERSAQKLNQAKSKGYTTSEFINNAITNSVNCDIGLQRKIMPHICKIQSEMEFEQDPEIRKNVREELQKVCLCLKSSLGSTTNQML